jgi:Ca2+-binding RTX toxin-like protein
VLNTPEIIDLAGTGGIYTFDKYTGTAKVNNTTAALVVKNDANYIAKGGVTRTLTVGTAVYTLTNVQSVEVGNTLSTTARTFTATDFDKALTVHGGSASDTLTYTRSTGAANISLTNSSLTDGTRSIAINGVEVANLKAIAANTTDLINVSGWNGGGSIDGGTQSGTNRDKVTLDGKNANTTLTNSKLVYGTTTWSLASIEEASINNSGASTNLFMNATDFTGITTITTGSGNDVLVGGKGNDLLTGGTGNDWISGNEGIDTLNGGAGKNVLFGGVGLDTITGDNADRDLISGGSSKFDKIDASNAATAAQSKNVIDAILASWSSGTLVTAFQTLNITGLNLPAVTLGGNTAPAVTVKLQTTQVPNTVLDDGVVDNIFAGDSQDWLFIQDKNPNLTDGPEHSTGITGGDLITDLA